MLVIPGLRRLTAGSLDFTGQFGLPVKRHTLSGKQDRGLAGWLSAKATVAKICQFLQVSALTSCPLTSIDNAQAHMYPCITYTHTHTQFKLIKQTNKQKPQVPVIDYLPCSIMGFSFLKRPHATLFE